MLRFLSLLALVALVGCSNPVDPDDSDHIDADGVQIRQSPSAEVLVNQFELETEGQLEVTLGETLTIEILMLDHDGEPIPHDHEEEEEFDHELEIVLDEPLATFTETEHMHFNVDGITAGETTFQVVLMHGDHADFTSQPITLLVQ